MIDFDNIRAMYEKNKFMTYNHISLKSVDTDRAVTELTVTAESLNLYNYVHGGAIYAMADCACGIAALTDGRHYVTMSSNLNFLHSGTPGEHLLATAKVRRRGHTTCYVEVDVTNGTGELLASGNSIFYCID